jgi:hypothetical protein
VDLAGGVSLFGDLLVGDLLVGDSPAKTSARDLE